MASYSPADLDVDEWIKKEKEGNDNAASEEYFMPDRLKLNLWGRTFYFPGNDETDPNWTVEALKERTFDDFRGKLIAFFISKSQNMSEKEKGIIGLTEETDEKTLNGNLQISDISFKSHGDPVFEKQKDKIFTFGETKYIGDVLYVEINKQESRDDIILPAWVKYCIKNEKKIRKQRKKAWNAKIDEFMTKTGKKKTMADQLERFKEVSEWTMKLIIDNAYKSEIDDYNKSFSELKEDSVKQIDYIELSDDLNEITVPSSITVGKVRELVYERLMKLEKNRSNMFLQNIKFDKNDVLLKHKFSIWVTNSDDTEMRHMGMVKNGDSVKIGIKVPLWFKVVHQLNVINKTMLDDNDEKQKKVKNEITNVMRMIQDER